MVTVTDLAWICLAVSIPVCLLAGAAILAVAVVASAKQSVMERTVEVLTRRLVALQARQTTVVRTPETVTEAVRMEPPVADHPEPPPDPDHLVDQEEILRREQQNGESDWSRLVDRRQPGRA